MMAFVQNDTRTGSREKDLHISSGKMSLRQSLPYPGLILTIKVDDAQDDLKYSTYRSGRDHHLPGCSCIREKSTMSRN